MIAFVYLLLPVAYTFAFSFNDAGRTNIVWNSFTFDNWTGSVDVAQFRNFESFALINGADVSCE